MKRDVEEMTPHEIGRWCALMEAVNIISDKCEERGIDLEKITMTQNAMEKYVEKMCDFYTIKVQEQIADTHIKNTNKRVPLTITRKQGALLV